MSRLLSLVKEPSDFEAAFRVFDSIRRPRAQKIIDTSYEAGQMYIFNNPDIGDDMQKIADSGNARLPWIWLHDLKGDVDKAVEEFGALVSW